MKMPFAKHFCAAALAICAASAGSLAFAFPIITLPNVQFSGGGNGGPFTFNLARFTDFTISVDFVNDYNDDSWASDMLLGIIDPSGDAIEFGGYNLSFYLSHVADFPGSWGQAANGTYMASFSLAQILSMVPTFGEGGDYDFYLENGYFESLGAQYNNVTLEFVPVPASLALFGIGLAGLGWLQRKKV